MQTLPIYQVDAFTDEPFAGNPAAVVILEDWIPDALMQAIATENNLAETAFVVVADQGAMPLRWFTPTVEAAFCGHATLATAHVLNTERGRAGTLTFDTRAGMLRVSPHDVGYLLDLLWHLVLPVFCLTYSGFAFLTKLTRSAVLENLLSDYARTARAKGVSEQVLLWRHVFRNSLLPLITVAATILPGLLVGSVIVETIFSIDGMGRLAVEAVQTNFAQRKNM